MKFPKPPSVKHLTLTFSLLVGAVLVFAAWGKFFYPAKLLKTLDQCVSLFEIAFLLIILIFRNKRQLWLGASLIFAAWSGYAIYWHALELPCNCMGAMLNIPSVLSITVDLFFYATSLVLAALLGTLRAQIYLSSLCSCMAGLVGYACADWVYNNIVVSLA